MAIKKLRAHKAGPERPVQVALRNQTHLGSLTLLHYSFMATTCTTLRRSMQFVL